MGHMQTMSQFIGPYIRQPYNNLTDKAKKIVEDALSKAEKEIVIACGYTSTTSATLVTDIAI